MVPAKALRAESMAVIWLEASLTVSTIMGALHKEQCYHTNLKNSPSANAMGVQVPKALSWREVARTLPLPAKKADGLVGEAVACWHSSLAAQ